MRALSYLQKIGAVPAYDNWDLLMSTVVICKGFFSDPFEVDPQVSDWVQSAGDQDDFSERCDAFFYATSGDVRALFPHIHGRSEEFLKGLIEDLVSTKLKIDDPSIFNSSSEEEWFANAYNDSVGLKGSRRFPSKASILHSYYSGVLTEDGQEILSILAGTEKDFVKKVNNLHSEFSSYVFSGGIVKLGVVEFEDERENPFEGGYQVKQKLTVPGSPDRHECTLHWAPWPTAKTKSCHTEIRAVCQGFTEMQRERWLSSLGIK